MLKRFLARRAMLLLAPLLVPLAASLLAGCSTGAVAPLPTITAARPVLFIGNSLTYSNSLPGMMQALAGLAGDTTIAVAVVALPDYALSDHYQQGTTRSWLRNRKWSHVVLQQGSSALPESQQHLRAWTTQFAPLIRESGAEPVLFMVWPSAGRLFDFPNVATSYRNAARAVDGIFAPAGDAWVIYAELFSPEFSAYRDLYADDVHPTIIGTYLSAIVLLERITGIPPATLPPTIPGLPINAATVRALQDAATRALARNPKYPHLAP
jgi:hypothetical protein